jgi:serine phosphatase RsbU (regulator of sigma subunit)
VHHDGAVEAVGRLGTLLGTDIDPLLADVTVELDLGDVLVLYTDGVTEVRAGEQEVFGEGDLVELLRRCAGMHPDGVAQRIEDAVLAAAGGRPRDDIAVLVIGPGPHPDAADPGTLPGAPRPTEGTDGRT